MSELEKALLKQIYFSWEYFYSLYEKNIRHNDNHVKFLLRDAVMTHKELMNILREGLEIGANNNPKKGE